jgi:hypothetical protein
MANKFKIQNLKFKIAVAALFLCSTTTVHADLEWINGGVPKGTTDKATGNAVKDAPPDQLGTAPTSNQDIVVSHMITTTKIVNQYPVDSVNYFYLNKNNQVCYFAYFLIKPSSRIHTATVECFSPTNLRIAKFDEQSQVGFTDRLLTLQNETYQWFLVNVTLGLDHLHSEYGQTGLPRDLGLYTIHLTVDGQLVGITFFYVKPDEAKAATPIATIPPVIKSNAMPMSTPFSNSPIPKHIPNAVQ